MVIQGIRSRLIKSDKRLMMLLCNPRVAGFDLGHSVHKVALFWKPYQRTRYSDMAFFFYLPDELPSFRAS
jgi:hypothetical protein